MLILSLIMANNSFNRSTFFKNLEGQISEEFQNLVKLKSNLENENENLKTMYEDLKEERNNELIKYYSVIWLKKNIQIACLVDFLNIIQVTKTVPKSNIRPWKNN